MNIETISDLSKYNRTPLILYKANNALINKEIEKLENLIKEGLNIHINNNELFKTAARLNNIDALKYLFSKSIESKEITIGLKEEVFIVASALGVIDVLAYLIEDGIQANIKNNQAIYTAVVFDQFDVVNYLVANGADVNDKIYSAVKESINYENIKIFKFFIECCNQDIDLFIDESSPLIISKWAKEYKSIKLKEKLSISLENKNKNETKVKL